MFFRFFHQSSANDSPLDLHLISFHCLRHEMTGYCDLFHETVGRETITRKSQIM